MKIDNMGAWGISLLSGHKVDKKEALRAFARHSSKNKTNAYLMPGAFAEQEAKARGDIKAAHIEFKKFQEEFHAKSNGAKNASTGQAHDEGH